jgi:hypothetical protein
MNLRFYPLFLVGLAALPGVLSARVFLLPNGEPAPGELGFAMAGARAALASGGEALWYNPAGLAREDGGRVTVSAQAIGQRRLSIAGQTAEALDARAPHFAFSQRLSGRRGFPRFSYGLLLGFTGQPPLILRLDEQREGGPGDIPADVRPDDLDTLFPSGLQVSERSEGVGRLQVVSPSAGLGIGLADWFRIGVQVRYDRLSLEQRSGSTVQFAGRATTTTANELSGFSITDWSLAGESSRLVYSFGLQLELSTRWVLGAAWEFPSETLSGAADLRLVRFDRVLVTFDGTGPPPQEALASIDARRLPFRLDSPRTVRVGLAYSSDWLVLELDVIQVQAQAAYTVLPAVDSSPPSTGVLGLGPVRTWGEGVVRVAFGTAFAQSDATSLLFGVATDPSPVSAEDPLFRRVSLTTVAFGVYHVRGALSGSLGLSYRLADEQALAFASVAGETKVYRSVRYRETALHAAGSLAF